MRRGEGFTMKAVKDMEFGKSGLQPRQRRYDRRPAFQRG